MKKNQKIVSLLLVLMLFCNNLVWAGNIEVYKLADSSNVGELGKECLPLITSVVEKVRRGELAESDFPEELIFLWEIASREDGMVPHLTPRERVIISEYIKRTNIKYFSRLLLKLLYKVFLKESIGAIGRGTCLARKEEVELYELNEAQESMAKWALNEIRDKISKAVSKGLLVGVEAHMAGQVLLLLEGYFKDGNIVTFNALVEKFDDYLVTFPINGKLAIARNFFDRDYIMELYHRLPEVLFRIGFVEKFGEITGEERISTYSNMLNKIFADDNQLAEDLGSYISFKLPGKYEIEFDERSLRDKNIDINKIQDLLRNKDFIFRTLHKLYYEYKFHFPYMKIGKVKVEHGGTGSQKQTLHVSFIDETTGFALEFALKVAINKSAKNGFAKSERHEIPTLRKLSRGGLSSDKDCKIPKFGVYIEDPDNNFYVYTERWIHGPTAGRVVARGKLTEQKLSSIVSAYLSVTDTLLEIDEKPRSKQGGYLGVYDVQRENVMFESWGSDYAVTVDIGKIGYIKPLGILQEFDRHYSKGDIRLHNAIFHGVMQAFGYEKGIRFLEEALNRSSVDKKDMKGYTREMGVKLAESLEEYIKSIYIQQITQQIDNGLHLLSNRILVRLASHKDPASVIDEAREWIFIKLYSDAKDDYDNDASLSNKIRLEAVELVLRSVSVDNINLKGLLDMPPSLDLIERLLDISFLLGFIRKDNIPYMELPDGTVIIDLMACRPKLENKLWINNTHPPGRIADMLDLAHDDVYLAVGGGSGVYNIAALLKGVKRSIWIDVFPANVAFVYRLKKYFSFIRDNREFRERIENEKEINIIDYIARIMRMHGIEVPEYDKDLLVITVQENANLIFGEDSLPDIDETGSPPLDIIVADAADNPLADNSVNKVSMLELFYWVRNQEGHGKVISVVKEVLRVTKPGGVILLKPDHVGGEDYYKNLCFNVAAIMGIAVRLKEVTSIGALLFEVVSKSDDIYDVLVNVLNREMGLDLSTEELRDLIESGIDQDMLNAFRGEDGRIDINDLKMAEQIAKIIDSFNFPEEMKMKLTGGVLILARKSKEKRLASAKERIARQIALHNTLRGRLIHKQDVVKNVFIDKECLPENQRFLLEGDEWGKRKQLLETLFPGYNFIIFSGDIEMSGTDIDKNNSIVLASESNRRKHEKLNARLAFIQNAGTEELFPLDALIYLGMGLLDISDVDRDGSPLVSIVSRLYKEITNENMDIKEFLKNYKLNIIIPPIEKFTTEELLEFHGYAISLLEKAA